MKLIKIILAILLGLLSLSAIAADATADIKPIKSESSKIDEIITAYMKQYEVPGIAVAIYKQGTPTLLFYGYANREKKSAVKPNTIFELGSISKIMTSLLLAQEVDMGNVQLSTSVTALLPDLPEKFKPISLKSLATHTADLPFDVPATVKNYADFIQYWQKEDKTFEPDKQWRYSNAGIGLLGNALAQTTKKPFYELYRRHILNPLGMHSLRVTKKKKYNFPFAQGYDEQGKLAPEAQNGLNAAAADLKASVTDMQKFLAAAIGLPGTPARILYPMRLTQSVYAKLSGQNFQGLGWDIHPLSEKQDLDQVPVTGPIALGTVPIELEERPFFNEKALFDKTGGTKGFRSYIALIPHEKSGVVILTNKFIAEPEIVRLGRQVLAELIKKEEPEKKEELITKEEPEKKEV